jgi:CheY-like chemotaxis protein
MTDMTTPTNIIIVLIEDDVGHALLIEKNIRRSGVTNAFLHFTDGTSALDYLFKARQAHEEETACPLLILLDLNLPDMSGIDVLKRVKADSVLKRVPVIMLTTTDDKLEIQRCYDHGCNVYITKPVIYQNFAAAVRQLGLFLSVIQVPETAPS